MEKKALNLIIVVGLLFAVGTLFNGWEERFTGDNQHSKFGNFDMDDLPEVITEEDLIEAAAKGYDYEYIKKLAAKRMKAPNWKSNRKLTSRKATKVAKAKKAKKKDKKKDKKKKKEGEIEGSVEPKTKPSQSDSAQEPPYYKVTNNYPLPDKNDDLDMQSAMEWVKKFIESPTKSTRDDFISNYLAGKISDAVYYEVVDQLYKMNENILNVISVQLLDLLPSSMSFVKLYEISTTGQSGLVGELANKSMTKYSTISHLGHLKQVIGGSKSEGPISRASLLLVDLANNFGKNNSRAERESSAEIKTKQVSAKDVRSFEGLISTIERAMNNSDSSSLRNQLESLVRVLEETVQRVKPLISEEEELLTERSAHNSRRDSIESSNNF